MAELRSASKAQYDSAGTPSLDQINCGSLQRIADAAEVMARRYVDLLKDVEQYRRWWNEERQTSAALARSNSALRGQITKLKKQLEGQQS